MGIVDPCTASKAGSRLVKASPAVIKKKPAQAIAFSFSTPKRAARASSPATDSQDNIPVRDLVVQQAKSPRVYKDNTVARKTLLDWVRNNSKDNSKYKAEASSVSTTFAGLSQTLEEQNEFAKKFFESNVAKTKNFQFLRDYKESRTAKREITDGIVENYYTRVV